MGLSVSGFGTKKFSSLPAPGGKAPKGGKRSAPGKPGMDSPMDLLGTQQNFSSLSVSATMVSNVTKKVTDTLKGTQF